MGGGSSQEQKQVVSPPQNTQPNPATGHVQSQQDQKTHNTQNKNTNISKDIKVSKKGKEQQREVQNQLPNRNDQEYEQKEQKPKIQLFKTVPKCMKNKPSSHICLSKKCQQYPFFCLNCEGNCEDIHHHNDRSKSVSLKQFEKRVQGRKNRGQNLKQTLQKYKCALEDLQSTFSNFYRHQYQILSQIEANNSPSAQGLMLKRKIQNGVKSGLNGRLMNQLWNQQKDNGREVQFLQYLAQKQELLVNMYECFVNINTIATEKQKKHQENSQKETKQVKQKKEKQQRSQLRKNKDQKAYHLFKRYQYDNSKLTISKQHAWSSRIKPVA